jgi:hypothetical protein
MVRKERMEQSIATQDVETRSTGRLRLALALGAAVWFLGVIAPGGWAWGIPGPVGHMQNYVISLWFVTLVIAPLLAWREPLQRSAAIQIYLLGILAIVASTFRGNPPDLKLIADVPPLTAAAVTAGLVLWAHPRRAQLWRT